MEPESLLGVRAPVSDVRGHRDDDEDSRRVRLQRQKPVVLDLQVVRDGGLLRLRLVREALYLGLEPGAPTDEASERDVYAVDVM